MNTSFFIQAFIAPALRPTIVAVFCGLLMLSGCGNKGPLYIPPPPSQPHIVENETAANEETPVQ